MDNKYFDIGIYDNLFFDLIMERGIEIYLSGKIYDLKQNKNTYTCKIQGTELYEVEVIFKDNDNIDKITCTCPFAKEGNKCKHMYALLLKIKCNYNLETIKKDIKEGLKEINQIFKDFDNDYIVFKYKRPKYLNDIENLKNQMNCFRTVYNKILENNKNDNLNILVLKDTIKLKNNLDERITNFNESIRLKETINSKEKDESIEPSVKIKPIGLFGTFINILDNINKAEEKRNKEYEEEQQRYRRTIIEKNLYEGKTNDEIYDGLDDL